jgi:hypothetical protein
MPSSPGTRPKCGCHGVEMWVGHAARGTWRCKVKLTEYRDTDEWREHQRDIYHSMSGITLNHILLKARRRRALKRMAERESRKLEGVRLTSTAGDGILSQVPTTGEDS